MKEQNEKQAIEEMANILEQAKIDAHVTIGSMNYGFGMWYAKACYNAGYRKQEWISVEDRLPVNDWGKHWKERKYYLVYTKPSGLMNVAVYGYKEHDWWIDRNSCVLDKKNYKEVTHWMPLPEPPKMKGGAE